MCLFTRFTTVHVGPGVPTRAGEPCSPETRGALLRRTGEGTRPYFIR
jgi:hypothetical protein